MQEHVNVHWIVVAVVPTPCELLLLLRRPRPRLLSTPSEVCLQCVHLKRASFPFLARALSLSFSLIGHDHDCDQAAAAVVVLVITQTVF